MDSRSFIFTYDNIESEYYFELLKWWENRKKKEIEWNQKLNSLCVDKNLNLIKMDELYLYKFCLVPNVNFTVKSIVICSEESIQYLCENSKCMVSDLVKLNNVWFCANCNCSEYISESLFLDVNYTKVFKGKINKVNN